MKFFILEVVGTIETLIYISNNFNGDQQAYIFDPIAFTTSPSNVVKDKGFGRVYLPKSSTMVMNMDEKGVEYYLTNHRKLEKTTCKEIMDILRNKTEEAV